MKKWYVLYTKPNAEYQVANVLRQQQVEVFLPEVTTANTQGEKKKRPFFPTYLFVRVDLENTSLSTFRWTPGLRNPVRFDGQPATVPSKIIAFIQQRLADINGNGGFPSHSFQAGDTVKITDGPFEGMIGIFDDSTSPAERVRVLLTILGNINRASIPVNALEKISTPASPTETMPQTQKRPRRTRGRGRRISKK